MILLHGTTLQRAELIVREGPDLNFCEPNDLVRAEGFSTAPEIGPYFMGDPRIIARGKARAFPHEGGPAILVMDVPVWIVELAGSPVDTEFRFEPGFGYEELMSLWQQIPKWLVQP